MLKEITIEELKFNPFTLISKEWMLITAGQPDSFNTMTASWGGLGELWGKYVSFVVVRPQRYTLEFIEREEFYTLSFFDSEHRDALNYCGAHSGRDVDKVKETGLTPCLDQEAPYFQQAKLVFVCKKLHGQMIDPECFVNPSLDKMWYPKKDYHKLFIGEIVKVLAEE